MQDCLTLRADRFHKALERLGAGGGKLLLAVSGGSDSLAMLLLAHEIMPVRIVAATVDHGLRPEAADEATFVARICAERGIAHHVLMPQQPITGNIQSSARRVRYALLEREADDNGCDFVATAHHQNDQLETLLMRVARGSGLDGLSGIRRRNGRIIRPMLDFSKAELDQICSDKSVIPVRDPGNDDADFDRVAMRQLLAANPDVFDPSRATRTASALADAGEALDWIVASFVPRRIARNKNTLTLDPAHLPRELQRRLLLAALHELDPRNAPRGEAVERLIDELRAGKTGMIGDILCKGGKIWTFAPAPPRRKP